MKMPIVSGKDAIKALSKIGYYIRSQKGSHVHLRHPVRKPLTVPMHSTIAIGTLKEIIKESGLTREEFTELLKG